MCAIRCQGCGETIENHDQVIQVRMGFIERFDYTPEVEIAYFHAACFLANVNPLVMLEQAVLQ